MPGGGGRSAVNGAIHGLVERHWKLPTVAQGQLGKEMNHLRSRVHVHGVSGGLLRRLLGDLQFWQEQPSCLCWSGLTSVLQTAGKVTRFNLSPFLTW